MTKKYNPQEIEKKWQKHWKENDVYNVKDDYTKKKFFVLDMFPYPSGEGLHVGHPKGYIATDVFSRFKKLNGFNVLHPMGWDAFGLPAENFAIKNKVHPSIAVEKNVKRFKEQLELIGFSYDWNREINTTDPNYYKWTQWIFLKLYEKGLAYESFEPINWCPSCKTGLSNEDLEDGKCERCGSIVEKKPMRQWVLKITDYAERLLQDLNKLDWEDSIIESQINWIGKSEGVEIRFKIDNSDFEINIFTTRLDTIFGCTYVVIAPENKLIEELSKNIKNINEVNQYIEKCKNKSDLERTDLNKEKTGIKLEGIYAINPFNNEKVEVWTADYVLNSYGTGAVMAVPAHDDRDFAFADKYGLKIKNVIEPITGEKKENEEYRKSIVALLKNPKTNKILSINWGEKLGGNILIGGGANENEDLLETAIREIKEETGYKNFKLIAQSEKINHHYFAFSKNVARGIDAYGFYFELIDEEREEQHLEEDEKNKFSIEWLDAKELEEKIKDPLHLYLFEKFINNKIYVDDGIVFDSGDFSGLDSKTAREKMIEKAEKEKFGNKKINYKIKDWVFSRQRYWGEPIPMIHCPSCGVVPLKEEDLPLKLPKVESYEPSGTGESPLATMEDWVNVKCPICGADAKRETNTMPQWAGSSWYYLRYIDPKNDNELVGKEKEKYWMNVDLYVGGAEHATRHLIYARFWHKFLYDLGIVSTDEPFQKLYHVGLIQAEDGRKMSKRYGNVINPDDIVNEFGADSLRIYEMFMGPFSQNIAWSTNGLKGAKRFLDKVWDLQYKINDEKEEDKNIKVILNKTIKKVTEDIDRFSFNTAVSQMMIFVNELSDYEYINKESFEKFLIILSAFAPHITEEIYNGMNKSSILDAKWPGYDDKLISTESVKFIISVNGKMRDVINIERGLEEKDINEMIKTNDKIQKYLSNQDIKKTIFVKDKMINFVI